MATPTISVIVTFHTEGEVAQRILHGIERLRRFAERQGIVVECVLVLDCADPGTIRVVRGSPVLRANDQVIEVSNRDPGASRNAGIELARGSFVAIVDGDDYCTENWLVEALEVSMTAPGDLIVHPELTISFGTVHCVARSLDMAAQPDYPLQNCLAVHPWISCSFGATAVYKRVPYRRTDTMETGFGFEDWHWNLETIAMGVRHVSASGTAYYYRRRSGSTLTGELASGALIRPTTFHDHPDRWNVRLRSHLVPAANEKSVAANKLLPQWAIDGFRQIAEYEPDLYPSPDFLGRFFYYEHPFDLAPGELYAKSMALLGGYCPDSICLVPWIAWGNTEDSAWQEMLAERAAGRNMLVVFTDSEGSRLSGGIPDKFRVLEFGEVARNFSEAQQVMALTRLVLQSTASDIYVINSLLGWNLVRCHGKSIMATGKTIYTGVWNTPDDQNDDRERAGRELVCGLRKYTLEQDLDELSLGTHWQAQQLDGGRWISEEQSKSIKLELEELRTAVAWLSGQRDAWKRTAERQEEHSKALELVSDEIRAGNAWLLEQRDAWQGAATAAARDAEKCHHTLLTLRQSRVFGLLERAGVLKLSATLPDPPDPAGS